MKLRSLAAIIAGAALVGAALLLMPVKAAAFGSAGGSSGAAAGAEQKPRMPAGDFLAGYDEGLYRVAADGSSAQPLWTDGEVRKILRTPAGWFFLTSKGVLFSSDLVSFVDRSVGLPVKTYKIVTGGAKEFDHETQDLKDLKADAGKPGRLLTCTKDEVFMSEDGGLFWKSLGQPIATTGLKAVAFAPYPGSTETAVWASHPIKGLFACRLAPGYGWTPVTAGLASIPGTTSMEEVADLQPSPQGLWASNSFLQRVYRWDADARIFRQVYAGGAGEGTVESIASLPDGSLRFVTAGEVRRLDPATGQSSADTYAMNAVELALGARPDLQLCALSFPETVRSPAKDAAPSAPSAQTAAPTQAAPFAATAATAATAAPTADQASLSELWLVSFKDRKPFRAAAENRQALYLATGFMVHEDTRQKYFDLMKNRGLNAVVLDMKDDFGRLRFTPRDPVLRKMGKVASPLDIESFVAEAKARGVYLIARIVVFKDEVIYDYAGGKYAVWDAKNQSPWQGYKTVRLATPVDTTSPAAAGATVRIKDPDAAGSTGQPFAAVSAGDVAGPPRPATTREPIKEYWVDPYSEDVWAYNVAIANEIIARGFDEVQFDYIRFPTDGENIDSASFRWRDPGMDKESALASFLRYARENVKAPISIDIYGANGWYRSGVRTGQDVELLAKYVDVICPMYYPSHFEQTFLAQAPAEERPYRIYRTGTFRTEEISRGRIVVRPYVQAFYMNVSYDRTYYNLDYVKREVAGVLDSVNLGMTFWNNAGRYDDVPVLSYSADGRLAGPGLPPLGKSQTAKGPVPGQAQGAASKTAPAGTFTEDQGPGSTSDAPSGLFD